MPTKTLGNTRKGFSVNEAQITVPRINEAQINELASKRGLTIKQMQKIYNNSSWHKKSLKHVYFQQHPESLKSDMSEKNICIYDMTYWICPVKAVFALNDG